MLIAIVSRLNTVIQRLSRGLYVLGDQGFTPSRGKIFINNPKRLDRLLPPAPHSLFLFDGYWGSGGRAVKLTTHFRVMKRLEFDFISSHPYAFVVLFDTALSLHATQISLNINM